METVMMTTWGKMAQEGWTDGLADGGYDIAGTLKFYNGRTIGKDKATALLGAYWHKVDRTLFGQAANNGYGVQRWCFTEYGSDGHNLHVHFIAKSPIAVRPCCVVLNVLWANMHKNTADVAHNWITPIQNTRAAVAYAVKGTRHLATDFIGEKISHTNAADINLGTFDREAQIKRITNKISNRQLEQAYKAMELQIVQTAQKLQAR